MSEFTFNCPHCEQSLEAPEDMLGQTIECPSCNGSIKIPKPEPQAPPAPVSTQAPKKQTVTGQSKPSNDTKPCPYCGEQIQRSAQKCKHCGEFLKGQHEVKTNVKQGALIGAVACFAIGLILMFISLWSFIIYSPLFLAAFVLSIVAMSQKRVAGGLIMLLLTLIVPPVLFFGLGAVRSKDTLDNISEALDEASAEIGGSLGVETPSLASPVSVSTEPEEPEETVPIVPIGTSITIDDVKISVCGVRIDHIERESMFGDSTTRSDDKYLLVDLSLQNTSPGRIIYLQQIWEHTKLIDDFDNIEGTKFSGGFSMDRIVGYIGSTKLKPGDSENDMMIFDLPVDAAQSFRIESDPRFWKSTGEDRVRELSDDSFKIEFKRNQIR